MQSNKAYNIHLNAEIGAGVGGVGGGGVNCYYDKGYVMCSK